MAKRLSGQSYTVSKWQGQSLNADSLAPPPLSFQLSNMQLGDEGRLISVTSCPIRHFSSTKQRKNCEADETSPSFPFILSPTSVPEEPCLRRRLAILRQCPASWCPCFFAGEIWEHGHASGSRSCLERPERGTRIK